MSGREEPSGTLRELAAAATPGPWYAIGTAVSKPEVDIVDWAYHDLPPAEWPDSVAQAESNARLIALAPVLAYLTADMADALKQLDSDNGLDMAESRDLLDRFRALEERAGGGAGDGR